MSLHTETHRTWMRRRRALRLDHPRLPLLTITPLLNEPASRIRRQTAVRQVSLD